MKYPAFLLGAFLCLNLVVHAQPASHAYGDYLAAFGIRNSAQLAETDYQELFRDFLLRTSERSVWDSTNQTYVPMGWNWNAARQRYEPGESWNSASNRFEIGGNWNAARQRYEVGDQWDSANQTYVPISWKWNSTKNRFEQGTRWNPVTHEWE